MSFFTQFFIRGDDIFVLLVRKMTNFRRIFIFRTRPLELLFSGIKYYLRFRKFGTGVSH